MNLAQLSRLHVHGQNFLVRSKSFADQDYATLLAPSIGEYPVYDEMIYELLAQDEIRMRAYSDALRGSVAGKTVVDIGTGKDAIWAIASVRAGASMVYAVECIPESAGLARATITEAGLDDQIILLEGLSTETELPEKVDVCVSEIIGTIGGSEGSAAVLGDARRRLVRSGGLFVPDRCVTTIAAVDVSRAIPPKDLAFEIETLRYLKAVFDFVGHPFDVRLCLAGLGQPMFMSDQVEVEAQDFRSANLTQGHDSRLLHVTKDGVIHGFAFGIRLWVTADRPPIDSTAQATAWFPVFAPISIQGVPVRQGDHIEAEFSWHPSDDAIHPDYSLTGIVKRHDTSLHSFEWESPHHGAQFRATETYQFLFPSDNAGETIVLPHDAEGEAVACESC